MKKSVQPSSPKINYVDEDVNCIKKMQSKNKIKVTSSLDNILTSCVTGNNHIDNDINFNMVEPIKEKVC